MSTTYEYTGSSPLAQIKTNIQNTNTPVARANMWSLVCTVLTTRPSLLRQFGKVLVKKKLQTPDSEDSPSAIRLQVLEWDVVDSPSRHPLQDEGPLQILCGLHYETACSPGGKSEVRTLVGTGD